MQPEPDPQIPSLAFNSGLSRRRFFQRGLAAGPALLLGAWGGQAARSAQGRGLTLPGRRQDGVAGCVASPQLTEGPYFIDAKLERWDIRPDPQTGEVREGVPL